MAEEGQLLEDLRVNDLKAELEKRNLDKHGIKLILADRLEKALKAEGHDPATFRFNLKESAAGSQKVDETQEEKSNEEPAEVIAKTGENGENTENGPNEEEEEVKNNDEEIKDNEEEQPVESFLEPVSPAANVPKDTEEEVEQMDVTAAPDVQKPVDSVSADASLDIGAIDVEMEHDPIEPEPENKDGESADQKNEPVVKMKPIPITMDGLKKEDDPSHKSVWVRGLPGSIKAADLKALFSKYGRVLRAKIFTSKKTAPTALVFGYVTMSETAELNIAIEKLNKTQYNGKIITVEAHNSRLSTINSKSGASSKSKNDKEDDGSRKKDSAKSSASRRESDRRKQEERKNIRERVTGGRVRDTNVHEEEKREVATRPRRSEDGKAQPSSSHHSHRDAKTIRVASDRHHVRAPPRREIARRPLAPSSRGTFGSGRRGMLTSRGSYSGAGGIHSRVSRPPRRDDMLDRREMMDLLRRKEEEHRKREHELKMEKEKERIRFEKEQLERQRLELQMAALQAQQFAVPVAPLDTRSRDYTRGSRDVRRDSHHSSVRDTRHSVRSDDRRNRGGRRDVPRSTAIRSAGARDHSRTSSTHERHSSSHNTSHGSQGSRDREARAARSGRDTHHSSSTRGNGHRDRGDYSSSHSFSTGGTRVYATDSGRAAYSSSRGDRDAYSSSSSYPSRDYSNSSSYGSSASTSVHFNKDFASRTLPSSSSTYPSFAPFTGTTASGTRYEWPGTGISSTSLSNAYSGGRTAGEWAVPTDMSHSRTYDSSRRY